MVSIPPFSLDRVAQSLRDQGYSCTLDEEAENVTGTWNEIGFRFSASDAPTWFRVTTTWRGPDSLYELDDAQLHNVLQEIANEWNRTHLQPSAYPFVLETEPIIMLDYIAFVGEGLTDKQLNYCTNRALDVQLQAHESLPSLIPPVM